VTRGRVRRNGQPNDGGVGGGGQSCGEGERPNWSHDAAATMVAMLQPKWARPFVLW